MAPLALGEGGLQPRGQQLLRGWMMEMEVALFEEPPNIDMDIHIPIFILMFITNIHHGQATNGQVFDLDY